MCAAITHRGPDARGLHRAARAQLGIQRLRVIDLETGDQPVYNEDGTVAVVLNGEIYNYRELRDGLVERGHELTTRGDSETIAHLYEELGPACVRELEGMFAFALWDERRNRLLLARDRVGKKPLFYWHRNGELGFASELAALMVDEDVPREVSPDVLDAYLAYGYVPGPHSIWRGVRKLEPASTLTFTAAAGEQPRIEAYWWLDFERKLDGDRRELEEELRRLVGAATRRRMVADVPLGAFLSGGVDSSIVVREMAAASSEPVRTFSIGFEDQAYNELPRARLIAERFATEHHELVVRPDAVELLPRMVAHYGEPYADISAMPSFYLAAMARRCVTVALNGDGGDENFGGYERYVANVLTVPVDRLPLGGRRALARLGARLPGGPRTLAGRAHQLLTSLPGDALERYRRHVSVFTPEARARLFHPDVRRSIDERIADDVIGRPWREAAGLGRLDTMISVDVGTYLVDQLLVKIDIATMAASLEARSPLLDRELMEFAAALPPRRKLHGLQKKWILRSAYRDLIPREILDGKKLGFSLPLGEWLRGDLREFARETLLAPDSIGRGWFVEREVQAMLAAHDARESDHSLRIWALIVFEHWQRAFVDRAALTPDRVGAP